MEMDSFYDWEKMSISSIIYVMVQWLNIHHVEFNTTNRQNVESGIWYDLVVKDKDFNHQWHVSSQRQSLLKERLIAELDRRNYRESYLKERETKS